MRRAVRLARRTARTTSPNPPVGAIVLDQAGVVVGEGFHAGPGEAHAEIVALEQAGPAARGGSLIVTLAPCTKHGRTPPCVDAVLAAGVRRVVIGSRDPNPLEMASSIERLRSAGVEVVEGIGKRLTDELIGGFTSLMQSGRPRFTAKLALTLDGRTAAADGSSRWITGPEARREVHRMRGAADAVLVGASTVIQDDPELTVRLRRYAGPQPRPIVVDSTGRTPPDAAVFKRPGAMVLTTDACPDLVKHRYEASGAEVVVLPAVRDRVDLVAASTALGGRGMLDVFVESGPTLVGALVDVRLIDRLVVYLAPKLLGAHGAPAIAGLLIPSIADAIDLQFESVRRVGADLRLEGRFVR